MDGLARPPCPQPDSVVAPMDRSEPTTWSSDIRARGGLSAHHSLLGHGRLAPMADDDEGRPFHVKRENQDPVRSPFRR